MENKDITPQAVADAINEHGGEFRANVWTSKDGAVIRVYVAYRARKLGYLTVERILAGRFSGQLHVELAKIDEKCAAVSRALTLGGIS